MSFVLLVTDRDDGSQPLEAILRDGGYAVSRVASGTEAPGRIAEVRPLAVVIDSVMPDGTCTEICQALRGDLELVTLPILILATGDDDPRILTALGAGADDYFVLGCAPEIVLGRLRRLIRDRQLARAAVLNEQLAQVGRLLTGIVHEIRGPLSVIRGQAELLRMVLDDGHEYLSFLEPILRNAQLLQARLEHLMAAVRGGPPALAPVAVNGLVREASDLFSKGADPRRNSITMAIELTEGLPPARADAGRLIQVLMNLLTNAREAILATDAPGLIRVRSSLGQDSLGPWFVVEVADNGPGIPEEQLDRIFEPFFTTKAEGSGYGLYLATEILREHDGRLTASRSDLGGACFTLWIPLATARSTPAN